MSRNYDNWERLVAAVIKKQQLWELFHAHSRSPSVLSDASDFSSILNLGEGDVSFGYSIPGSSSPYNLQQAPLNKSNNNPGLVFISDFEIEPIFDLEDLLRASPEMLGRGTFGSVYAAKMENGITVGVKRLKMVNNISEQGFAKHMGIVGNVKHENVAALRAYYCSPVEKLLIYDYYSDQSVSALLHGKTSENRATVDWKIRVRIALGAARGISYIHTQNYGTLVHGNIKASNIFLNSQQYGHVSDLGLASMIATSFPQSSRCYAPEVKSTRNVSQASDVYGFGILLFELLTRKSPDPALGHEAVDLVKLVNSVRRKEWSKVFDGDLLLNPIIREQIVRMLEIGISCVVKSPKKRPKMSAVVKMIEDIGMMITKDEVPIQTERNNLVFLGDGNPTFDLEDLLRASAEVLGKGTFGTSYKAKLENGIIISVQRLRDVSVTNKEFQQQMEIIGRMEHANVVELKAYYYYRDESLLIYDYYDHGSLSALLHGRIPVDWSTRLNIAISAAKGIAHIHTKNGQKLVHGNIRASNILLNEQQDGIVSDVGLGKLVSATPSFLKHNAGYRAPESTNNGKVSQASDVYSFGVLLLEILSGRSPPTTYKGEDMSLVRWIQSVVREEWTAEVFDAELLWYGDVDEEMLKVMQIAMHCATTIPERRPKMADVVKMLEEIQGTVTAR